MKILHVTNHFWPCVGGIEKLVMENSKGIKKKGFDVKVVCLNKCSSLGKKLKEKEIIEGIAVERIGFIDLKYYKIAPNILSKINDCDILHVYGLGFLSDFLLATKVFHRKKVIVTTGGGFFHTHKMMFLKKIYFNLVQRILLKKADTIIAISENDALVYGKLRKDIKVIEPGVNLEKFSKLGTNKEKNSFLFVGRISANKRVDLLIKRFAEITKEIKDAKLYIVGEDWEGLMSELKKIAEELGIEKKVLFAGKATDKELMNYYDKSEFFVSASEYEGFGITTVEAMAAGCIPIVSNIPTFKSIITKESGFTVNWKNTSGLNIVNLIKKRKKEKLRENAQKRSKNYSQSKKIEEYSTVIKELLSK